MGRKPLVCIHGVFYLNLRDSVWTLKLVEKGQLSREYQDHPTARATFLCKNSNNNHNVILTETLCTLY